MFPQIFGKYVLERELAAGGMAKVFLATLRGAVGFEKRLVVKQIRPELASDPAFVRRFVEEAKTAVELSHPNIVPVYELGVEQGVYYIAMEFCTGLTLAELLNHTGKLSPEEGAYVGVEICRALDYAHRRAGIVHRDATPRNVLIDEEGAVRLIDFGIAAPAFDPVERSEVFGSPGHMPPEQLAGKPLTPATDVFAAAALLVEAWSGRPPFRRGTARESEQALHQPLTPLTEYDEKLAPLAELLTLALRRDPSQRPSSAELFARPLRDFLRSVDMGDIAHRLGERVRRSSRDRARGEAWSASDSRPVSSDPLFSQGGTPLTRTFAARNEVKAWTESHPPPPPVVEPEVAYNTRKLPSLPPASDSDAPIESDTMQAPRSRTTAGPGRVRRAVAIGGALALLAGASLALLRPRSEPTLSGASSSVEALSRVARARRPEVPPAPAPRPPAPAPSSVPQKSLERPARVELAAASAAPQSSGVLRLTADPPASVSVHGLGKNRSLVTPVRELHVPAGPYTVTFRSDTYDSPVVARVVVQEGVSRSVHADFREADPRVTIR